VTIAPRDDGVEAEQELVGRLFAQLPGDDPHALLRAASLPGCRYHVVDALLRDSRFGPRRVAPSPEPVWEMFARWLISLDGERHRRVRRHFQRLFTPRRIDRFRTVIEARATELIDAVATHGEMDLVTEFARPLPLSVILEILGVPPDRHDWLRERMLKLGQGFARRQEPEFVARASEAVGQMLTFFSAQIDERIDTPRDDLLSVLANSIPDDEHGRPDVLANCIFFIEAGHATTTSLISAGTLLLLEHPPELERLRDQPGLIPLAVEEMLRLVAPVTLAICCPREDVSLDGYRFHAEVPRFAFLAAANRDPAVFPEPDQFDIDRAPGHLAFSSGAHFCLGAPLARLHGEIALTTLLARLPGLRAAGEADWRGFVPLHELEHLQVAWDVA
jgi:pimeloyl-[acyl-carrier protein] synthase